MEKFRKQQLLTPKANYQISTITIYHSSGKVITLEKQNVFHLKRLFSMAYNLITIKKQIEDDNFLSTFSFGSSNTNIHHLQNVLFEMGFANELNWEKYGADGAFGNSTSKALKAFGEKNKINTDGKKMTSRLAKTLLHRYAMLDEIQHLNEAIQSNSLKKYYSQGTSEKTGVAAMQTLLKELGYGKNQDWDSVERNGVFDESVVNALKAFGKKEGIETDGTELTKPLAERMLDKFTIFYGPSLIKKVRKVIITTGLLVRTALEKSKTKIYVSDGEQEAKFTRYKSGFYTSGNQNLKDYLETERISLRQKGMTDSAINIMLAVSENEGNLDAINTWDNSFLSFGMFQWTLGPDSSRGELAAFFKKIKINEPEAFWKYFGNYGLDVSNETHGVSGFLTLEGTKIRRPAQKDNFRSPEWGYRFWQAGRDNRVKSIEVEHSLSRLERFYWKKSLNNLSIADLITSEFGVGLLLDNHVNRPGYVAKCVGEAFKNTNLGNPQSWSTEEERILLKEYLRIRESFGRSPMTHARKREKATRKYLRQGIISDERGSFVYKN